MKTKISGKNNLVDDGKANWERTDEFNKKVHEIKRDLSEKYAPILLAEKNWFKRILMKIRLWREMKEKIDELSSWKNLHLGAQ